MKSGRLLLLIMIITVLVTGVVAAQDETVLVIGHAESTDSLDPARGYTQTKDIIDHVTYENLVTFPQADASEILPMLATDWTISEDGLTYTFNLRGDAVFSDGSPVTADDVAFSVNRLKYVQGSPSFLAADIASVTADDADTVSFTLTQINPAFLANLANTAFGVVNADVVRENGGSDAEDAATADTAEAYLNGTSAGSGPYLLESWEPQVETVLVRNPNFYGDAPYFDRIIITNIPEAATQKVALESGEIDLALDLTSDQIAPLEGNPAISIYRGPGNIVHFLLMNEDPDIGGPVSDPLVQRAIRLALDYEGYQALWGGVQPGSITFVGNAYAFTPEQGVKRNLDEARALLAQAGYADGFDITLEYPIFTFQGVNMETNAQKIQADLAEVGINVTLSPAELQVALENYRTGAEGFGYWFWGPDILDAIDMLAFLPGGKVADERALWTPDRADAALNDLVARARVATDPAEREEVFTALQASMQENSPFAPFIQPDVQTAFRSDIEGYVWHPQWLLDVALLSRSM
ncbi:MAG: ABC transporter substrate-binding protein [Anaerolineae bacterium]|nr:ABC transporter substrate-binding protein [Anaerolineae bacterium]